MADQTNPWDSAPTTDSAAHKISSATVTGHFKSFLKSIHHTFKN